MSQSLKAAYLAMMEALRILLGRPETKPPTGTGGAIG
jgi:hypothetical protein